MVHSAQNEALNNCFVYFALLGHPLFTNDFECVLIFFVVLYFKYLSEGPIRNFANRFIDSLLEDLVEGRQFIVLDHPIFGHY